MEDTSAKEGNAMQEQDKQSLPLRDKRQMSPVEFQEGSSPLARNQSTENVKRLPRRPLRRIEARVKAGDTQKGQGLTSPSGAFCGISLNMLREAIHSKRQTEQRPDLVLAIPQEPLDADQVQSEPQTHQKTQEKGVPVWEKLFRIGGAVVAGATSIFAQLPREVSAQDIHNALEASKLTAQTQIQEQGMPSQRAIRQTATGLEVQQEAIKSASQGDPLQIQETRPKEIIEKKEIWNYHVKTGTVKTTSDGRVAGILSDLELIQQNINEDIGRQIFKGQLDENGQIELQLTEQKLNFNARAIAISETDSNLEVIVGDNGTNRPGETTDGTILVKKGNERREINVPGVKIFDVQITPDNLYAFVSIGRPNPNEPIRIVIVKLTDYQTAEYAVQFPTGPAPSKGQQLYDMTSLKLESNGLYTGYALLPLNTGYVKLTLGPISAEGQRINISQSYSAGLLRFFDAQQRNRVWNNYGNPMYDNINDVQQSYWIQPGQNLYPEATAGNRSIYIGLAATDVTSDEGYIVTGFTPDTNNNNAPAFVERLSISRPTDQTLRKRLDNGFPTLQSSTDLIFVPSLNCVERNGKKLLVVGIERSEIIYIPEENREKIVFREGYIVIRDTSSETTQWRKIPIILVQHVVRIPILYGNAAGASW